MTDELKKRIEQTVFMKRKYTRDAERYFCQIVELEVFSDSQVLKAELNCRTVKA